MIKALKFSVFVIITATLFSCGNNKEKADKAYNAIIEIEGSVVADNDIVSQSKLAELLAASEEFIKNFPDDERAPAVMQKGIRSAVSLNNYSKAIILMDDLIKNYSTEKTLPEYLFQKAFIVGESGALGEADKIYEQLITQHPEHELAEQAKLAREMLTMTDEELIKKLENAQAAQE
jgi:outer membrane protein assembly factor BamD (BamD/ComL family)